LLLKVENVELAYGEVPACRDVSFEVAEGEIVALIGANGAGKSTTLRGVAGAMLPRKGKIVFDGAEVTQMPAHRRALAGIALVPEGRRVFAALTVRENLEMGGFKFRRDRPKLRIQMERMLEMFPRLRERTDQRAGTLSGGEQQMLSIGRALMTNPALLILDEATEGLAPIVRAEIWSCLERLKQSGLSILLIDKHVEAVTRLADHHYVLEKGRVVWDGTSAELRARPDVQHHYLGV
jgi:branched-chain amino acid transport system ATP-binding protein